MDAGLKVFSGSAHRELAEAICGHLGIALGRARTHRFTNENLKIKIEDNVREADVFVVQPSCPPVSEGIIELLIMIDALRSASARRITAVMPYFPYARSDKKDEPRISITARLMADLIETAGADRALMIDLHSPQLQGFFRIPSDQLSAIPLLTDYLAKGDLSNAVVVAPDAGEAKDAGRFAKKLNVPLAILDKRRYGDDERAHATALVGDVRGKRAILVNDEVATFGTMAETIDFVRAQGATSVTVAAVHAVLSGPAVNRLRAAAVNQYIFTDSLPIPPEKRDTRMTILSVAKLLAEGIARIHDGRSVSELYA